MTAPQRTQFEAEHERLVRAVDSAQQSYDEAFRMFEEYQDDGAKVAMKRAFMKLARAKALLCVKEGRP